MSIRLESLNTMACMKTLFILFNLIFGASGVLMLCFGIWIRVQLNDYVDKTEAGSGVVALLVIACVGVILALASILACCCTARGHPALLYLYGAFLAIVALLDLSTGATVYAYRTYLNERFTQELNDSMISYNQDLVKTSYINSMQSTLHCCGSRDYTDWLSMNPPYIPTSCCKVVENCDRSNSDDIYTEGCYNFVIDFINSNVGLVAGTCIGIALFPLVGVFLACCLANNINKAKYDQVA